MAKGYQIEDVKEKLINVLGEAKTGLSGTEISEKLGINRVTMTKYLNVFSAEGLIHQKNIGNVNLWFVDEGAEQFHFPDDYFKAKTKYLECLVSYSENQAYNLIRNCIYSNAVAKKIHAEIIIPAISSVKELYDEAKIGNSELNLLNNIISNSIQLTLVNTIETESRKNVIVFSADEQTSLMSQALSASYRSEGWQVYDLRNMSESINVIFDLDLQKFLGKIWKQKTGIMIIVVISETEEGLNFFSEAVNSVKEKIGKNLFLVLCGSVSKKTKLDADLISDNADSILQWSQTVFESHEN